jgi:hypothetical protein
LVRRAELAPHWLLKQRYARLRVFSLSDWHLAIAGRIRMNGIIYIVGLVVVVIAVLSFFGLR